MMKQATKEKTYYLEVEEIENEIELLNVMFKNATSVAEQENIEAKIDYLRRKRDEMESEVFNY